MLVVSLEELCKYICKPLYYIFVPHFITSENQWCQDIRIPGQDSSRVVKIYLNIYMEEKYFYEYDSLKK